MDSTYFGDGKTHDTNGPKPEVEKVEIAEPCDLIAKGKRLLGVEPTYCRGFVVPPQIMNFNRVFHEINHTFWGFYPYFWKHPYQDIIGDYTTHVGITIRYNKPL